MHSLRVGKNYWPKPNVLAWPDGFSRLDRIFEPVIEVLDRCWWYIGGQGVMPPLDLPKDRKPTRDEIAAAVAKSKEETTEICKFLTDGGHFGRPGFFSRGGKGLSGDWKFYAASDYTSDQEARKGDITGSVSTL